MKRRKRYSGKIQAFRHLHEDQREQRVRGKIRMPHVPRPMNSILSHRDRKRSVTKIRTVLEGWTSSPFEREAAVRYALRERFCMGGHGWQASDREAAEIVRLAFDDIGVPRPSWAEGQWSYTIERENCQWCGRAKEDGVGGQYCSKECARSAMQYRDFQRRTKSDAAYSAVQQSLARFDRPLSKCQECGHDFPPVGRDQKLCSPACQGKMRTRRLAEKPHLSTCVSCRNEFLSTSFKPAIICCSSCKIVRKGMKDPNWSPQKLNKAIFEQFIIGNYEGPRLTEDRFDRLIGAARPSRESEKGIAQW